MFEPTELTHIDTWTCAYRGIGVEIKRRDVAAYGDSRGNAWTYYLYIDLERLEDKSLADSLWLEPEVLDPEMAQRKCYRYNSDFFTNIEFHGGMTFYEREYSTDHRFIKIGCDYQHYGDDWSSYTERDLLLNARCAINGILDSTVYLQWCGHCGKFFAEADGAYTNGRFYCNEHTRDNKEKIDA